MKGDQDLKAGPSVSSVQSLRRKLWQRSFQVSCIFLVLLLGYTTLTKLVQNGEKQLWKWGDSGSEDNGQEKSSKGSKYLLGVGKADITG